MSEHEARDVLLREAETIESTIARAAADVDLLRGDDDDEAITVAMDYVLSGRRATVAAEHRVALAGDDRDRVRRMARHVLRDRTEAASAAEMARLRDTMRTAHGRLELARMLKEGGREFRGNDGQLNFERAELRPLRLPATLLPPQPAPPRAPPARRFGTAW